MGVRATAAPANREWHTPGMRSPLHRFILSASCVLLAGCGDGLGIYRLAREAGPVVQRDAVTSSQGKLQQALSNDVVINIVGTLTDFENPRDQGTVGMESIYHVLWEAGDKLGTAELSCQRVPAQAIASPWNLGFTGATYDCAVNSGTMGDNYAQGLAIRREGTKKHLLMGFRWAPRPDEEQDHGVIQGWMDETSGDLDVRMVFLLTKPIGTFVRRVHIAGNAKTHAFTLAARVTTGAPAPVTFVATGTSKGAGQHMLFKLEAGGYFCVPASPRESSFDALDASPTGSTMPAAECAGLKAAVDGEQQLTAGSLPTSVSEFGGGSVLLTFGR